MIELGKVSNASNEELNKFFLTAPSVGKKLGVLAKDVISVTAEVSKLGYSFQEAQKLGELAILGKVVGDLDNVGDSISYITSVLKGFKLETDNASKIVDFFQRNCKYN